MKTLYFVRGVPTLAQTELAGKAQAKIRNALAYHSGDFIEPCDFVMGDFPIEYGEIPLSEYHGESQRAENPVKRGRPRKTIDVDKS